MNYKKFYNFTIVFVLLLISSHTALWAYNSQTIYPQNDNISQDLDLDAVASIFGLSSNLEDFEYRLNDPDSQISNLDIDEDGYVDYLRVVETAEDDVRHIVIQAALDNNIYQDVATIIVRRDLYQQTSTEIVGDSYIYGSDYVLEPRYSYTPIIYSYFWSNRYYQKYHSRYRHGYYPERYRRWRPHPTPYYRKHIHHHIDKRNHYRYRHHSRSKSHMTLQRSSNNKKRHGYHKPELYKSTNYGVSKRDTGRAKRTTATRSKTNRSSTNRSVSQTTTRSHKSTRDRRPKVSTHKSTTRYYNSSQRRSTKHYNSSSSHTRKRDNRNDNVYRDRTKAKAYLQTSK